MTMEAKQLQHKINVVKKKRKRIRIKEKHKQSGAGLKISFCEELTRNYIISILQNPYRKKYEN
jgi:hypothetical protein